MRRLLITAFQPFSGQATNSSQIVLETWRNENPSLRNVDVLYLPVTYSGSFAELQTFCDANETFDFILMLGQAAHRSHIGLERVALNWTESKVPDEAGKNPKGKINADGPEAYFSNLPLEDWAQELNAIKKPTEVSLNAGGYVCNYLYYQVTDWFQRSPQSTLFVHWPIIANQTEAKQMAEALNFLINKIQ
jgi:pyroglutamyl-peptidase